MELTHQTKTERLDATNPADITRAAEILRKGGTVAFPTETVYGLGANALSPEAVEKIFIAKQRPHWDPLIVHISSHDMLAKVWQRHDPGGPSFTSFVKGGVSSEARPSSPNPAQVLALIEKFWPGPLTLLLPRTAAIPDAVTAGRPLVGVRMPAHPVALELIRQAGVPIAAPSANLFGHTSPTSAAHVLADLDGRIDAILDGGPTTIGLESTVAEPTLDGVVIYRPGAVTTEMIESILGPKTVTLYAAAVTETSNESLPSPGVGLRHYAPKARLVLINADPADPEHSLLEANGEFQQAGHLVGLMLPDSWAIRSGTLMFPWGPWDDPETLARRLFAGLHSLDDRGATIIICPVPSIPGIGEAIRDRLQKAAR